jgi:hypothetical protein
MVSGAYVGQMNAGPRRNAAAAAALPLYWCVGFEGSERVATLELLKFYKKIL